MSRAYRIRVRESVRRALSAEDEVQSRLEILEILPAEQMAELLARELEGRGFARDGDVLRRDGGGVTTAIDAKTGTISVKSRQCDEVTLEGQREHVGYDDFGPGEDAVKRELRQQLHRDLDERARGERARLQDEATRQLEDELARLGNELNQAVNRVTAAALKQKAGQLGKITEVSEDESTGSLSITVEV